MLLNVLSNIQLMFQHLSSTQSSGVEKDMFMYVCVCVCGTCWVRGAYALSQCWVYWHDWGAGWQTGSSHYDLIEAPCCCSNRAWETPTRLRRQRGGYVSVWNVCNHKQKQVTAC